MRINSDIGLGTVAKMYEKNSALGSVTKAADWFADVEKIDELKKALIMAIDCGNFDKALFILKQLQALKTKLFLNYRKIAYCKHQYKNNNQPICF